MHHRMRRYPGLSYVTEYCIQRYGHTQPSRLTDGDRDVLVGKHGVEMGVWLRENHPSPTWAWQPPEDW